MTTYVCLYDAHCHPTDTIDNDDIELPVTKTLQMAAMATRHEDQDLVDKLALKYHGKVIPCFGLHPWYA